MSQIYTAELPLRNLIGVEDAGLITESRSIPMGQGILAAGTILGLDGTKATAATVTELHRAPAFCPGLFYRYRPGRCHWQPPGYV